MWLRGRTDAERRIELSGRLPTRFTRPRTYPSEHLHLIPRSAPSYVGDGFTLDINALGYAGMLLVRSEGEAVALNASATRELGLINVIAKCALPRKFGEQALEADATQHGGAGAAFDGL